MKLNISQILPDLRVVTPFANKSRPGLLPIYSAVKLSGNTIEAFNGECGVVKATTTNWKEIECAVLATPLISLLEKLADTYQEVDLTVTEEKKEGEVSKIATGKLLVVTAGTFSAKLFTFPLEDYPENSLTKKVLSTANLDDNFLKTLRIARFSSASDLAQQLLASVALRGTNIYAAEAKRMYRATTPTTFSATPVVVISELVDALCQIGESPSKLDILDGLLVFHTSSCKIFGARFADDVRYPQIDDKLDSVLASGFKCGASFDSLKLAQVISRLLVVNSDTNAAIHVKILKEDLTAVPPQKAGIQLENKREGNAKEFLECKTDVKEPDFSLVLNGNLLLQAIERFSSVDFYPQAAAFVNADATHLLARLTC